MYMMKSKYRLYGVLVLSIIGVVLISGCNQTLESTPRTTQIQEPACTTDWQCSTWSECSQSGVQSRTCTDSNSCGTTENKPSTTQSCTLVESCTENWNCGDWSSCTDGQQTRTCTDINNCGSVLIKPTETQDCEVTCTAAGLGEFRCLNDWVQQNYRYSNCTIAWVNWQRCDYGCVDNSCQSQEDLGSWELGKSTGITSLIVTATGNCPATYCNINWGDGEVTEIHGNFIETHTYSVGQYSLSFYRDDDLPIIDQYKTVRVINEDDVLKCEDTNAEPTEVSLGGTTQITLRTRPDQREPYLSITLTDFCSGSVLKQNSYYCEGRIGGWKTCYYTCENFESSSTISPVAKQFVDGEYVTVECPSANIIVS